MLSPPADNNHNSLQPRARKHATDRSPMWSPEVRVESRRPKAAPWRPPESTRPRAKSFVSGRNVRKLLIFLKWHGRGREFESHQVHQNQAPTKQRHTKLIRVLPYRGRGHRSPRGVQNGVHISGEPSFRLWEDGPHILTIQGT